MDVNLGVGYVNERTIPGELIIEATREVLAHPEKYPTPCNYGGSKGSENLINAIRRFHVDHGIGGLTDESLRDRDIIIGPNGATSLLEGIANVVEPGIVVTTDPMYYIYCNFLERRGFEVIAIPEDDRGIRIERLSEKLRSGVFDARSVRFFYIVTVNNPSGTILSNERRRALVDIAGWLSEETGRTVPVFFDRAYEDLIHDPAVPRPSSAFPYDDRGLAYEIGTLSKILAPALRIGYMIGRDGPFLRALVQKTSDAGFSAPLITQEIAGYLLERHVTTQIGRVNAGYREKARIVGDCIREELGGRIEAVSGGRGGFYYYLTFRDIKTTEASPFFRFLARTTGDRAVDGPVRDPNPRVIYVPGEFCVHPRGDMVEKGSRQLRLSYGFEETRRISIAVGLMKEAAEYARSETS